MKKSLIGIAAVVAMIGGPAMGADLALKAPPPPPVPTWTGCYLGANAGGDWSRWKDTWTNITEGPGAFAVGAATLLPAAANTTLDRSGFLGGGQFGCNNQTGAFVLGIETDVDYTDLRATRTAVSTGTAAIVPFNITESFSSDVLSTLRLRAGIANGPWLFYVTGGGALADGKTFDQACTTPPAAAGCNTASSRDYMGWTAGGGVEWMVGSGWSIKAEYLYADLLRTSTNSIFITPGGAIPNPGATITHNHDFSENIARLGINYHFNFGPVVAKY